MLNTMVMSKRYYDDDDICWCSWILLCKVILLPSDERYRFEREDKMKCRQVMIIVLYSW